MPNPVKVDLGGFDSHSLPLTIKHTKMAGCYGSDAYDRYWEAQLDKYLDDQDDDQDEEEEE